MGSDTSKTLNERVDALEEHVAVLDARLGIDVEDVKAGEAASLDAGAEAAPLSEPPEPVAIQQSIGQAKELVAGGGSEEDAIGHLTAALVRWSDDPDLLAARADLEATIAGRAPADVEQAETTTEEPPAPPAS